MGFRNSQNEVFHNDRQFERAVLLPKSLLLDLQFHFMEMVDHELFVAEEVYFQFSDRFIKIVRDQGPSD